jgi:hypothetical protein
MKIDPAALKKAYEEDGYVVVRNVFSAEEMLRIRDIIAKMPDRSGDVLTHPDLRWVLLDERVISVVKALLGERIGYLGDSTVQYVSNSDLGEREPFRCYHQDSTDDFEDPSITQCPILRIGFYLQDQASHSGGLKVRRGSHKHVFLGRQNVSRMLTGRPHGPLSLKAFGLGKGINLNLQLGDLAFWNLRTWHSGYAVRIKHFPNLCINPRLEKYIPHSIRKPAPMPRGAIFATFGAPSSRFETYIAERTAHPSNKQHWEASKFDTPEVRAECAAKGVELRVDAIRDNANTA